MAITGIVAELRTTDMTVVVANHKKAVGRVVGPLNQNVIVNRAAGGK
jgi:hypothetical protein